VHEADVTRTVALPVDSWHADAKLHLCSIKRAIIVPATPLVLFLALALYDAKYKLRKLTEDLQRNHRAVAWKWRQLAGCLALLFCRCIGTS
jgi:hypothetical protein